MNIIYFDGACGPYNPGGHMGCGVIIKDKDNNTIHLMSFQVILLTMLLNIWH